MYCANCGSKANKIDKFCGACGHKLYQETEIGHEATPISQPFALDAATLEALEARRTEKRGGLIVGIIWLSIGAVVTVFTYSMADAGGTYYLFWGPMIYGGYKVLKSVAS